jgi:3-(3-hydroxy-phenyl)propionate hydroxylase
MNRDAGAHAMLAMTMDLATDVLIVGAGPAGLTLANLLGKAGLQVLVVERNERLIDYPRGVSLDDESLRVFQAIGLAEEVVQATIPDQWIRYVTPGGRCFASVEPRTREFGWPRRNAFIQPLVDKTLLQGLARFPKVKVWFGAELAGFQQDTAGVLSTVTAADRAPVQVRSSFIVGCDGGRSTVRKALNIAFEGKTDATRWLVIDVANDPLGIPDAYLFCDPKRPHVSMALPHAMRRLEFMLFDHEREEDVLSDDGIRKLLQLVLPNPAADIIRARVYTHHARLAQAFVSGRALLAGDAAHLMPVWQGQGFNSGVRDVSNIAWKIAAIQAGLCEADLLSTYESERRPHAASMISLSVLVGRIFSPTNRVVARTRDVLTLLLSAFPSVKSYVLQMKFKPMPCYQAGAIVPAPPGGKMRSPSPVGRMFPQPWVIDAEAKVRRLDDVMGDAFSLVSYGLDPRRHMSAATRSHWQKLGARFVCIAPSSQFENLRRSSCEDRLVVVTDRDQDMKQWFGKHQVAVVVLRPDRFVAAAGALADIDVLTERLMQALCSPPSPAKSPERVAQRQVAWRPAG